MSTHDEAARVREPWEVAHDCDSAIRRARRRRSLADRMRVRARRVRSARGSLITVTAMFALLAPLSLATGGSLLQRGSSGAGVAAVQRALGVSPTGNFGPVTARAVRAFQRSHGLVADGIVGPRTSAAIGLGAGSTPPSASTSTSKTSAGQSDTLARIAQCESGGNPTAVSAGGRYRGKYQFSRATWRAMGGTGDPAKAPESEQDQRAAALLARSGTSPWPVCG
jgi:peptidoglycan hydrolase-like protein with peptidoglycan-binding domain